MKMRLNPFKDTDFLFCPQCGKKLITVVSPASDPMQETMWLDCPLTVSHYSKYKGRRSKSLKFDPTTGKKIGR